MKKILSRFTNKNIKQMRNELARAHLIIALLSVSIISLLTMGVSQPISFDPMLSAVSVALLSIVTIISLCITISLYRKK